MKKSIIFLFVIIALIGCTNPSLPSFVPAPNDPNPELSDPNIIGTYERDTYLWEFSQDGTFTYYSSGEVTMNGWYFASSESRELYIEDFVSGSSGVYFYSVDFNLFGMGKITLTLTPSWVGNPVSVYWERVE